MPYITFDRRQRMRPCTECSNDARPVNAGELNYAITMLLINYWRSRGHGYQQINDIIGACEGAKAEFQRRVVGKYEDQKILENGDCYL